MLEILSFVVMVVVTKIWKNLEMKLIFFILFLHVVLPFTFLKNSSENKQRLVDANILNIVKSIIGFREKKRIYPIPEVSTVAGTLDVNYRKKTIPFGDVIELSDRLENPFKCKKYKDHGESHCIVHFNFQENLCYQSLETLPSVSTSDACVFNGPEKKEIRTKGESSGSDADHIVIFRDDIHSLLAGEILEMMKINIDAEYRYIFYLRELLRLEEVVNSKYGPPLENFDINRFDEVHFTRRQKAKNSKEHKNEKRGIGLKNEKIVIIENYFDELNIKFLGNFSERRDKRKATLKHFREDLQDRTSYNEFLNDLLNLEEGLRE